MAMTAPLPPHAEHFHSNMALGITINGYHTVVNIHNYYNHYLFEDGFSSKSFVEVSFYMGDGSLGFDLFYELEPGGNLNLDIAEELKRSGKPTETIGTVYCRMIPEKLPPELVGYEVPTEFTAEMISSTGQRDFMHNTGGQAHMPSVGQMQSGMMFADKLTDPKYIVLVNNYFGPKWPFISDGLARVEIVNHRGKKKTAVTQKVPARNVALFSLMDHFPDLYEHLEGESGRLNFFSANLARKPWVWFETNDGLGDFCLEHL